jgi:sugar O-acyltransferase (sialic acid O-acetyltransferase NeuD family)
MARRLAIFGASGHGRVARDSAFSSGWDQVVFFDDDRVLANSYDVSSFGGSFNDLLKDIDAFDGLFVAIGTCSVRHQLLSELIRSGGKAAVLIHKESYVARDVSIGVGSLICVGAIVQPGVSLAMGAIVNTGSTIDHDCVLGEAVHVCPGAHLAGGVRVGDRAWIGIGASVIQGVSIGEDAVVGAGAVVVSDVPPGSTVVGVPARVIKSRF